MPKNYYDILGVSKSATETDIKKAYKKMAMQYHPDRNKGDKNAEKKFKEINEAYQTLGDAGKKKNYDQFGSAEPSPFSGGGNPFGGQRRSNNGSQGFGGFEDIFSQFSGGGGSRGGSESFEFDISDLFGAGSSRKKQSRMTEEEKEIPKQEDNLDITEAIEIPFLDFLYDTALSIKTVYGKNLTLKVKAGTKPGTKFKISGKGRSMNGKIGDMYVIVDAKMPKNIDPSIMKMVDAIRYQI